ncbi:DNA repair protein RecO [Marseilla massiliensis]|uniref:DNA repair protein RecO n=1 Tax=Marseilla massiliensis TaxID=1841864 RepID=A0A938WPW7_9BACT|nr:DNA repair protein RecO [Marseilla massiliensis]MBM6662833.1 DNA repair protein RecO [Marseilla massiliensis]HIV83493.1 DNA repair protein RecO [Candidatus Prevotella intestinigallinarum]
MIVNTDAIVLRAVKYGDSKLVVDMFTRQCGRLSFIVSVPRSGRGRIKKQYFQPLTQLSVACDVRPRLQLQRLGDASMAYAYATLTADSGKLAVAMFVAEFLCHALRDEQQGGPLFDYLADSLQWLDSATGGYANFHLVFLMRLTRFLGFYPNLGGYAPGRCFDLRSGCFCDSAPVHSDYLAPGEAALVGLMMRMDYATMHLFRLSRGERNRMVDVIVGYYRIHMASFPELRSLAVLRSLFG